MLKEGNDHFEITRQEPKVDVCEKRYVFNAEAPQNVTPADGIKLGTPWGGFQATSSAAGIAEVQSGRQVPGLSKSPADVVAEREGEAAPGRPADRRRCPRA